MSATVGPRDFRSALQPVRLFLCGDVMIGRGIDQILREPCDPALHEAGVHSAADYVTLAEQAHGPIPRRAGGPYVWGDALDVFERMQPDLRIVNLETSVTCRETYLPKGINYRVSPANASCLRAARIDCCVLANNHVLDWDRGGLLDTLASLEHLGIRFAGAGRHLNEARAPATLAIPGKGQVRVYAYASPTSGVPARWAAGPARPGVSYVSALSDAGARQVADCIAAGSPDGLAVVSMHWGPNWGYEIAEDERRFAHALIDSGLVCIVHGHSSHHAKAIEVYRGRLILYGCGDFLNDYEGIRGYESYRGDLALMYFADIDPAEGGLVALRIVPLLIRKFRLVRASDHDVDWIRQTLDRECRRFGASLAADPLGFSLSWDS